MTDAKNSNGMTYEEVKLEPWWNQAPPFPVGNKLSQQHGLGAITRHTLNELKIDPQYFLDIKIDRYDYSMLVEVLDTVELFAESIMALIVETDDTRPLVFVADYSEVAMKAGYLKERIRSKVIEPSRSFKILPEDSSIALWEKDNLRLNLLMQAMNQCHGILGKKDQKTKGALVFDDKRRRWDVAGWIRPYKLLLAGMVNTVERMVMLMTHWTDLGNVPLDGFAEVVRNA